MKSEIAETNARILNLEAAIAEHTAGIMAYPEGVVARASYRPLAAWAEAIATKPDAKRVVTFRQTSRSGNIDSKSHRCVLLGTKRDGWWIRIHESDSTRASVLVKDISLQPNETGLVLTLPLDINLRTQVEGRFRPRCAPWLPSTNIGITGTASPTARFGLTFSSKDANTLGYKFSLMSPNSIGMEMRADFNLFRVGFTIPVDGLARELFSGDMSLAFNNRGTVQVAGKTYAYEIGTVNPEVATNENGVRFSSDVALKIDK